MTETARPRRPGWALANAALGAYGLWIGAIFIAWIGFGFAAADLLPSRRRRTEMGAVVFVIGGCILLAETFAWHLALWKTIAGACAAIVLVILGSSTLLRMRRSS